MSNKYNKDTISILIYLYGEIASTYTAESKADAKRIYYKHTSNLHAYTQLVVNDVAFNTAKAESYLGNNRVGVKIKPREGIACQITDIASNAVI